MKRKLQKINASFAGLLLAAIVGFSIFAVASSSAANQFVNQSSAGKIVVANRASGTISVIDVQTDRVIDTFALPAAANLPEPMYVVYSNLFNRIFVGDRANNRVVVFDANDFSMQGTIPAGAGIWHMWADEFGRQLWVDNDIDNTVTVIDTRTLSVITTIPTPADLVAMGGRPHDVILDPTDNFAFVSMIGVAGANDFVVKYSTQTFAEVGRAAVGKDPHLSLSNGDGRAFTPVGIGRDPHLSLSSQNDFLYVPCQVSNVLIVLNRNTMTEVAALRIPGAHGAGMARDGQKFYTTNLPGGGPSGLFVIDTNSNTIIGSTDTPYSTPHNIALTPNGMKLYVTHSGASANKVTIYTVSNSNPVPTLQGEAIVGLNPFGLTFVP